MSKKNNIKCPHCGYEYLPAEIYFPDNFLGKPEHIIKDENGKILGFDGEDMNTSEVYTCDNCGKVFTIDGVITFKADVIKDIFN